jgi:hypothetical protein
VACRPVRVVVSIRSGRAWFGSRFVGAVPLFWPTPGDFHTAKRSATVTPPISPPVSALLRSANRRDNPINNPRPPDQGNDRRASRGEEILVVWRIRGEPSPSGEDAHTPHRPAKSHRHPLGPLHAPRSSPLIESSHPLSLGRRIRAGRSYTDQSGPTNTPAPPVKNA